MIWDAQAKGLMPGGGFRRIFIQSAGVGKSPGGAEKEQESRCAMEMLTGHVRAAVEKYQMIEQGDRVAVGVSGGKDSMFLLYALDALRRYYPKRFQLAAVTIDPGFDGKEGDYEALQVFCRNREIPLILKRSNLAEIVFSGRDSPCSLCARMRRGMLHNLCVAHGFNKIALGHHMDDAVQTVLMNLFYGGKIGCFSPVTWLSRKQITMIRPLLFCPESGIRRQVRGLALPVVKSLCPVDGLTARRDTAELVARLEQSFPDLKAKVIGAIQRGDIDGWGLPGNGRRPPGSAGKSSKNRMEAPGTETGKTKETGRIAVE